MVRFHGPLAEGEAKAGLIGASRLDLSERFANVSTRQTTAFVLDLDEHAFGAGDDP